MNARTRIQRLQSVTRSHDDQEALRAIDALLADAYKVIGFKSANVEARNNWIERARQLGYGTEDQK